MRNLAALSCRHVSLLALLAIAIVAEPSRADDAADIVAAGRIIGVAWEKGDAATVKSHTINDEKSSKFVDAMTAWLAAQKKLGDAAVAKFGESGKTLAFGQNQIDVKKQLDNADVKVNGDTAIVTPKAQDVVGEGEKQSPPPRPLYFKKENGEWKMDMTRLTANSQLDKMVSRIPMMAHILNEVADEITGDKYKSVEEVQRAVGQKMSAARRSGSNQAPSREKPAD